jgi:8-oxo-dGTP diphosphatase
VTLGGRHIEAAGGVVWRYRADGRPEFLVVHRPRYADWTLPKGKLDGGESLLACAEREVVEETGSRVKVGDEIGSIAYLTPQGNTKSVRYWLMEHIDGSFRPNAEVDKVRWLRARKARAALTYSRDHNVLDRGIQLAKRPASGRIYLVRHANAGTRGQWTGNDKKRPLTQRGLKQAFGLQDNLSSMPITDVLSSRTTRCIETVRPLAESIGLEIRRHATLSEGAGPEKVEELVALLAGRTAALCTHRDVISGYLGRLAHAGVKFDGPSKWRKGSTWVLETRKTRVVTARYLPPAGI